MRERSASDILTRVASEIGLVPAADPWSAQSPEYAQLRTQMNTAGQLLIEEHQWQGLTLEHEFVTTDLDTGDYPLPAGYVGMLDQTHWDRANEIPLFGPTNGQGWQYLLGRNLVTSTIYLVFRIEDRMFRLFPQPPPVGSRIAYEYRSDHWVKSDLGVTQSEVLTGSDKPIFPALLMERYVKYLFLRDRGFDTTTVYADFMRSLSINKSLDEGGPVLNAARTGFSYPYLDSYRNTPDSGFGSIP